ncbi:N-acetyltransferase family protein [Parasphingorhabdus sp. DH2-15]|uniref:GNAT family N-acetyltransferase n=1 Tax=Parasphingorhabdus sp. DH2-15 TaxID=3444112 RepID=UPI003F68358F
MIIRAIQPGDRMAIADIHTLSWQQSYRYQMPVDFLDNDLPQQMREYWQSRQINDDDIVLVAENNDKIIGFAAAWHAEPLYLDNLHVVEAFRSHGLGRRLMGEIAKQGAENGCKAIDLHVVIGNERAEKLYLALGGVITATEDKPLSGIAVPHYRISWPDIRTLIAKTTAN